METDQDKAVVAKPQYMIFYPPGETNGRQNGEIAEEVTRGLGQDASIVFPCNTDWRIMERCNGKWIEIRPPSHTDGTP